MNHQKRIEREKYPFLAELLPREPRAEMDGAHVMGTAELAELYRWFHATWHGKADGRLAIAVSNSAPQRVREDYFAFVSEVSGTRDLPFDIDSLETKLQRVLGIERSGKSLVRHVHDLGFLDERVMVIHAIWVDDADLDLLAAAGCTVAHNPVCNLKLGSGVMPFRRLRERGIPIALGSDERASDDTTNMWAVGKLAALLQRIADPDYERWPEAGEILGCLTRGGARGMRQPRIGSLAVRQAAGVDLLRLDSLAFTPLNDVRRQLVFSESGSSVVMTMVAGRIVVDRGAVLSIDEAALKAEIRPRMPAARPRPPPPPTAAARPQTPSRTRARRAAGPAASS